MIIRLNEMIQAFFYDHMAYNQRNYTIEYICLIINILKEN